MDMMRRIVPLAAGLLLTGLLASSALAADINLLNVSYDPTRELYAEFNGVRSSTKTISSFDSKTNVTMTLKVDVAR